MQFSDKFAAERNQPVLLNFSPPSVAHSKTALRPPVDHSPHWSSV